MKNILIKIVALTLLGSGALMMSQPSFAGGKKCITDGGFHDSSSHNGCYWGSDANNPGPFGICGESRVPKGWYCAPIEAVIHCTDVVPDYEDNIQRKDGTCTQARFTREIYCALGEWYTSADTAMVGNCRDITVA